MEPNPHILKHHHITLSVGTAQEDYSDEPIYHLYYGNDLGDESTLITCFPMRQSGRKARPGTGQIKCCVSVTPVASATRWSAWTMTTVALIPTEMCPLNSAFEAHTA